MPEYSIKDLEKLAGIKAHTIRIWEKRYNLIIPKRTDTNIRVYCDDDLKKIINVSILIRNGFKISKISEMNEHEINEKISLLSSSSSVSNDLIEGFTIAMIEFDEVKFEKIFTRAIMQMGLEKAVITVLAPFLRKVRTMWQTSIINHAQENFIINLIRQKIFVSIDGQISKPSEEAKTFCLFNSDKEINDLGLLFYSYLLRKRGHKVIYLGVAQPFEDVSKLNVLGDIDYFITSIQTKLADEIFKFASEFHKAFPDKTIYLSGKMLSDLPKEVKISNLPSNVFPITSPEDFIDELESLKLSLAK